MNHSKTDPYFPENLDDFAPWVARNGLTAPYGECQCGCGKAVKLARKSSYAHGYRKGHPGRYLHNHHRILKADVAPWVDKYGLRQPYGKCQCGCGQDAVISKASDTKHGVLQGHPRRFARGHDDRTVVRGLSSEGYAPWVARHGLRVPYGKCQCGCGHDAEITKGSRGDDGYVAGQPTRFKRGHGLKPRRPIDVDNQKEIPGEIWREVAGFNGRYQASNMGRVRSQAYVPSRILKPVTNARGYRKVNLYFVGRPGDAVTKEVHRLVLETFVGPSPRGMEGCHSNGNKLDNRLCNLRWDTHSANAIDKRAHGTAGKLTPHDVQAIRTWVELGVRQVDVAEMFGISRGHLNNIIHKRAWRE